VQDLDHLPDAEWPAARPPVARYLQVLQRVDAQAPGLDLIDPMPANERE